jgi:hypothetical protein
MRIAAFLLFICNQVLMQEADVLLPYIPSLQNDPEKVNSLYKRVFALIILVSFTLIPLKP